MLDFDSIKDMAVDMMAEQKDRNRLFEKMSAIFFGDWLPPGDLSNLDWFYQRTDSRGHDAIKIASQVLSTLDPKITYLPRTPTPENKARASEIEQMLKWWLMSAAKRTKANHISDLAMSSLLYDTIAVQVVHLGYQQKVLQTHKLGSARMRNWKRYGPFALKIAHPATAYPIETDYGLDGMLTVTRQPLSKVKAFWGERAGALAAKVKDPFKIVTIFDYMDPEVRSVWAAEGEVSDPKGLGSKDTFEIVAPIEHKLEFFPHIYRSQATNLADTSDRRLLPLLYSAVQFNHFEDSSLLKSLIMSEVIATYSEPMLEVTGPNPELAVEDDYDIPGGQRNIKAGHTVQHPPRRQMDRALQELEGGYANDMERSTGTEILRGGNVPGGTAFSTINLATQTGVQRLKPAKQLVEVCLAEICEHMLLWAKESGDTEVVISQKRDSYGRQMSISPDEIDPAALYITAELHPDVPTDRLARINGSVLLTQHLGYSKQRALEEVGVSDPDLAIQEGMEEQMLLATIQQQVQAFLAEKNADTQLRLQAKQMIAQQMLQGGQQGGGMLPPQAPPGQGTPSRVRQVPGGPGMNPAVGGTPPAQANPSLTRERASGRDRRGNEIP